jgi:hypothetical protein
VREGALGHRTKDVGLDLCATAGLEQVADLGDHGSGDEDEPAGKVKAGEQAVAGVIIDVVANRGGHQRPVSQRITSRDEAFGERVLMVGGRGRSAHPSWS